MGQTQTVQCPVCRTAPNSELGGVAADPASCPEEMVYRAMTKAERQVIMAAVQKSLAHCETLKFELQNKPWDKQIREDMTKYRTWLKTRDQLYAALIKLAINPKERENLARDDPKHPYPLTLWNKTSAEGRQRFSNLLEEGNLRKIYDEYKKWESDIDLYQVRGRAYYIDAGLIISATTPGKTYQNFLTEWELSLQPRPQQRTSIKALKREFLQSLSQQ